MKRALLTLGLVSLLVVGCAKKASDATAAADAVQNESVVDVSAQPMPQQQPQPVAPQPVVYDDAMTTPQAPAGEGGGEDMGAAGTYTVKKGDTLYSIARQRYGDGKQWTRIADANPGLDPTKIKVGQTLNIP